MKGEPAAQRVIEIVHLARAEQKIISRLAAQAPAAGMPVRPGIGEVERVNQRRVGVGAEQQEFWAFSAAKNRQAALISGLAAFLSFVAAGLFLLAQAFADPPLCH